MFLKFNKFLAFILTAVAFSISLPAAGSVVGTRCVGNNWKEMVDYFGANLPGNPTVSCRGVDQPANVVIGGTVLTLYPQGSGRPQLATYGAVKAECDKLMPGHHTCHTTDPVESPVEETNACGYPSPPAFVLACDKSRCVSEIYGSACANSYPEVNHAPRYSVAKTPVNGFHVIGAIYGNQDYAAQSFATNSDFTTTPKQAEFILNSGRMPILGLSWVFFNSDGSVRPDAASALQRLVKQYPNVFGVVGLPVEIYDEPFLGVDPSSIPARADAIRYVTALVHNILPKASLGVVVAPVWNTDSTMIPAMESILPGLQWLATDPYAQSLDPGTLSGMVYLTRQFADYMRQFHPEMPIFLIIQGFAPVNSPEPSTWNQDQSAMFMGFLNEMGGLAASLYDGAMIWGWSNVYELPPQYAGKNFPPHLKQFYLEKTLGL